jgi:hypothetical protein
MHAADYYYYSCIAQLDSQAPSSFFKMAEMGSLPTQELLCRRRRNKVCSALDPDKGTELELTVYTLTVHDGGVNQGLCAESKMYIDDLRVKGGVILGRGWEVHVFFVSAQRCGCAVAPPGAAFCPGCMLFL